MAVGPLAYIGTHAFVGMLAALVLLGSFRTCRRAVLVSISGLFLAAWSIALLAIMGAWLALAGLASFGKTLLGSGASYEPLSVAGAVALLHDNFLGIGIALFIGLLLSELLTQTRVLSDPRSASEGDETRGDQRAHAIGNAGELLVASELARLGFPAILNLVLVDFAGNSVEMDHVVRVGSGLVVLETKTWSGFITGAVTDEVWTQHKHLGAVKSFQNPALQNLQHVGALEWFVGDWRVPVRGFVVSAGHARFADGLRSTVVPLTNLAEVLDGCPYPVDLGGVAISGVWRRLEKEEMLSSDRRDAHRRRMQRRRRSPSDKEGAWRVF
jgi:hypothetical protein